MGKGSTDSLVGFDNLMARSNDGRLTETFCPDGTVIYGFK